MEKQGYVVSLMTPYNNQYVAYSHREFADFQQAAAWKQHMIALGHVVQLKAVGS